MWMLKCNYMRACKHRYRITILDGWCSVAVSHRSYLNFVSLEDSTSLCTHHAIPAEDNRGRVKVRIDWATRRTGRLCKQRSRVLNTNEQIVDKIITQLIRCNTPRHCSKILADCANVFMIFWHFFKFSKSGHFVSAHAPVSRVSITASSTSPWPISLIALT